MSKPEPIAKPDPILRVPSEVGGSFPLRKNSSGENTEARKVSFAAKAFVSNGSHKSEEELSTIPTKKTVGVRSITAETYSDASSAISGDSGKYEIIEFDPNMQVHGFEPGLEEEEDFMGIEPAIGENTPAAEALRASAAVRVSRVGKAARAVNMQAVRKLVKRATGTTKSGNVKGKPPRVPPNRNIPGEEGSNDGDNDKEDKADEHITESDVPSPQSLAKIPYGDNVVAGTVEAGQKVLGAVDPHDMLKVVRWRKRKKGDQSKPKSYAKGKVIDGQHELYTLSIAVMIGVRTSISKTNVILNSGPSKRWVLPQDYRTTEKYEFRPKGGTGMPSHQLAHTFKFKDYAPVVFAYLRRLSGINEFDFLISVCGNANFIEFISNAKSGQFFFYSSDGRYMIKTMTNAESRFLRRILPDYFRHCCENPNTMITRFFGMYRVKLYHLRRNVKFVIMNSVYYTDKPLQSFYDLKGSVIGREAKPGQAVKKDNDLRRVLPEEALALVPATQEHVRKQLIADTEFLEKMGIMDYSMLVGVHFRSPGEGPDNPASAGKKTSNRTSKRNLTESEAQVLDDLKVSSRQLNEEIGNLQFEDGLDDDDSSYLKGSVKRSMEASSRVDEETEQKKQATIEKLYWPFHQLFDIHGHRRIQPVKPSSTGGSPEHAHESLQGYKIPQFEPPLSDRKDGGFEWDTTGLSMPFRYRAPDGSAERICDGKIFYMGIIDVLQEYNSRKYVEAQYRLMQSSGKTEASCVDPMTYGERFVKFFDEYTTRPAEPGVEITLENFSSSASALRILEPTESAESAPTLTPTPSTDKEDAVAPQLRTPPRQATQGTTTEQSAKVDSLSIIAPSRTPRKSPTQNYSPTKSPKSVGLSIHEPSNSKKSSTETKRTSTRLFGGRRKNEKK